MGSNLKQSRRVHNPQHPPPHGRIDEGLALFREMKDRETRNYLYPPKDHELEASEFGYDETFRISSPTVTMKPPMTMASPHKFSTDLLTPDPEKNDYDWLLTPPTTPLFPSLDQDDGDGDGEMPSIVNLSQRRILTRSSSSVVAASKAYTQLSFSQETPTRSAHHGSSARHPSPNTSSALTPRSNNGSRGRPCSPSVISRSNSTTFRALSPCRPSTPPTPTPAHTPGRNSAGPSRSNSRSSTPTLHRNNTSPSPGRRSGSGSSSSTVTNGKNRGKSLSPKFRPWEPPPSSSSSSSSCLPGFSADAPPPPNLRTSLSDRPSSSSSTTTKTNRSPCRGHAKINRPKARTRSLSGEASEMMTHTQWHSISSSDVTSMSAGSWRATASLHALDQQSASQAASSSCFDDDTEMAESVISVSTRTSSDNGSKSFSSFSSKPEDQNVARKCVVPALKRQQVKAAAAGGDQYSSFASRRSYERQAVTQKRSSQSMFRPLLSNVPATSLYTTRAGYTQQDLSGTSLSHSPCVNDDVIAREDSVSISVAETINLQMEMMNHDADASLTSDQEEEHLESSDGNVGLDSLMEGEKHDLMMNEEEGGTRLVSSLGAQPVDSMLQEGTHTTHKQNMVSASQSNSRKTLEWNEGTISREWGSKSIDSEHRARDNDIVTRAQLYSPTTFGNSITGGSTHGSQKNSFDVGSFRKQNSMSKSTVSMTMSMRSQDSSIPYTEKAASCDLSRSGSHRFSWSSPSIVGDARSVGVHSENMPDIAPGTITVPCDTPLETLALDGAHLDHMSNSAISEAGMTTYSTERDALTHSANLGSIVPSASSDVSINEIAHQDGVLESFEHDLERNRSCDGSELAEARAMPDASNEQDKSTLGMPLICDDELVPKTYIQQPSSMRNMTTLEEATNTILFCSSIIHELVYKAASLAIQQEQEKLNVNSSSKREIYNGLISGSGQKTGELGASGKKATRRNGSMETSSLVQKQWMVHRQTPAVTMRHNAMDDVHNAIMGNYEQQHIEPTPMLHKAKNEQSKRVECKCNCSVM